MAQVVGWKCDSCGTFIEDEADRTRKRVRFEGPVIEGDYTEDLCRQCAPQPEDIKGLRPIQRRKRRRADAPTAVEAPEARTA